MIAQILLTFVVVALVCFAQADDSFFTYATGSTSDCGTSDTDLCSPVHWDSLDEKCSSTYAAQQSPINIVSTSVVRSPYMFGPVAGNYHGGCTSWTQSVKRGALSLNFKNFNYQCEDLFVTYEGSTYTLTGIEFHSVSEHAIGGGRYEGEVQLVHSNGNSTLIVAVLLRGNSFAGTDNPFLTRIMDQFEDASSLDDIDVSGTYVLNPYDSFTPARPSQFHYVGSLTKPPCTSKVSWFVFEEPVFVSYSNLESLRALQYNGTGGSVVLNSNRNNNRPLQEVTEETEIYYIPGGVVDTPSPTLAPVSPTQAPSQNHRMPQNAVIVGSVSIALSGVLLLVTIVLFFIVAKNHTSSLANELAQGEGSENLL